LTHEAQGATRRLQCPELSEVPQTWVAEGLWLDRLTPQGGLTGCLVCGHAELYTQRDFPRWLGFGVVGVAAVLAPFTHYLSLLAAAALDFLLYRCARSVVVCYVCRARHRGFAPEPRHPRYDLGIAERLRYGPKAVMGTPLRRGGTAGAPEPEH
jgi:hypothetical protein